MIAMAGVSDWHKKERKKELKKNKDARLAARNERVLVEKSIPVIRKEIEKLEASLKQTPSHGTQMKVDRLNKELKLLLQNEETSKKSTTIAPIRPPLPVHEPLPDPRVSIYFDVAMNPYGEPPPGRPRLFHRRGGGTTLTLREACVPGEDDDDVDAAAVPSSAAKNDKPNSLVVATTKLETTKQDDTVVVKDLRAKETGHSRSEKPPPTKKVKVSSSSSSAAPQKNSVAEPVRPIVSTEPKAVPELPRASSSVKRSKKLAVDIWASTLELEYDNDSWEYRDSVANALQGPFSTQQMQGWIQAGHFPAHILARKVHTEEWRKISQIKDLWGERNINGAKKRKPSPAATNDQTDVQKRMAALRQRKSHDTMAVGDSVLDRIAALRGDAAVLPPPDDDVRSRIAALRKDPPNDDDDDDAQSRIARLRAGGGDVNRTPVEETTMIEEAPFHSDQNLDGVPVEDDVPTRSHIPVSTIPLPPPPPPPPVPQQRSAPELPSYPAPLLPGMPLPPPPPAPLARQNIDEDLPSYPSNIESSTDLPAYPLLPSMMEEDVDIVAPYPMPSLEEDDGLEAIAAYPMDISNMSDFGASDASPMPSIIDDSRPVGQPEVIENPRPGLKKAKIDKSLVAFLPTALQRKRPQ
jgi:GYF domain/WW domain binding protein 11/mRNA biogenesis factor